MSTMSKWVPLVKRLAKKQRAVNLIYSAEDLEQEAWINIVRYWPKIEALTDVEIEKNIKTIFKRKVIDIIRSQMRRPDTHWSFKSNVIDGIGENLSSRRLGRVRSAGDGIGYSQSSNRNLKNQEFKAIAELTKFPVESGRFTGETSAPDEAVTALLIGRDILAWAESRAAVLREELEEAQQYAGRAGAGKDLSDSEESMAAAEASLRILNHLINTPQSESSVVTSNIRKEVCDELGVSTKHWDKTLADLRVFLSAEEAA